MKRTILLSNRPEPAARAAELMLKFYNQPARINLQKAQRLIDFSDLLYRYFPESVTTGTDVIFLEGVQQKHIERLVTYFFEPVITVNKKNRAPFQISPDIIISTDTYLLDIYFRPSVTRRYTFYDCLKVDDFGCVDMQLMDMVEFYKNTAIFHEKAMKYHPSHF